MKITYRITFGDRFAFNAYTLARNPILLLVALGFIIFTTLEVVLPAVRAAAANKSIIEKLVVFIFVEVFTLVPTSIIWAIIVMLAIVSKMNKTIYCERSLEVGDIGFTTESQYGRSEIKWSIVQKLARTRKHTFIYTNQSNALVVPRRAFESSAQWDEFYEICKRGKSQAV